MSGKLTVLISDPIHDAGIHLLEEHGFDVVQSFQKNSDPYRKTLSTASALVVRSGTEVSDQFLEYAPELQVIVRAGVGVDNIDLEATTRRGILVMNTPQGNVRSAAEHTLALLLSVARNIPEANQHVKDGKWDRSRFSGKLLEQKTITLIGLGNVGGYVAKMAQGFNMKVLAYDPYLSQEKAEQLGVETVSFEEGIKQCDFLSLHVPLNDETRNMIQYQQLKTMKSNAYLINVSRGGIVNEQDLARALSQEEIRGAGIDVFSHEPPEDSPLLDVDGRVVLTPHLGASTEEAQEKVARDAANQIIDFLDHDSYRNAVNLSFIADDNIQSFINLTEMLGHVVSRSSIGTINEVKTIASGSFDDSHLRPLSVACLKGVLSSICEGMVNFVNAGKIARERGIEWMSGRKEASSNIQNAIEVILTTSEETLSITGTILEDEQPRIIQYRSMNVDLKPFPYLLMMSYPDQPGQVGIFGSILGEYDINIARMEVARQSRGQDAIVLLSLDDPVSDDVQQQLREKGKVEKLTYVDNTRFQRSSS